MVRAHDILFQVTAGLREDKPMVQCLNAEGLDVIDLVDGAAAQGLKVISSRDGPISVVFDSNDPKDFSRQTGQFDWHKDGLYLDKLPEVMMLYCVDPGRGNTPTVVGDCEALFDVASPAEQRQFQELELVYIGPEGEQFPRPLVERHPRTGRSVLNIGQRAIVRPRFEGHSTAPDLRSVLPKLRDRLNEGQIFTQTWHAGDLLMVDNMQFAHARRADCPDPDRRLLRLWFSRTGMPDVSGK